MNSKKLLSLLLTLAMAVSMMATLGISAFAGGAKVSENVNLGETKTITFHSLLLSSFTVSEAAEEGSIKAITASDTSAVTVSNLQANDNDISFDVTGVKVANSISFTLTYHDGAEWKTADAGVFVRVKAQALLDTEKNTKTLDQLYSANVTTIKTNVTKVQVSWKLEDIQASVKINKIWDPDTLKWVDDKNNENSVTASDVTAEFDFVNLSSLMIDAEVEFKAATNISATATYKDNAETTDGDGKIVLDTANTTESTYDNTGKVVVSVPADKDFFKTITEDVTDGTYGTYTITIGKHIPKTFAFKGFYDEKKGNATANEMSASALCQYMLDYDMITDASKFGDVEVISEYYSKVQTKNVSITRKLSLLFDTASQDENVNKFSDMYGDNDMIPDKSLIGTFNGAFEWNGTAFVKKAK